MSNTDSLWYRIGYALERTRHGASAEPLRGLAERSLLRTPARSRAGHGEAARARKRGEGARARKDGGRRAGRPGEGRPSDNGRPGSTEEALEALLAAGAGTLAGRVLGLWRPRRRPGVLGLARGAAAGAGAALLRKLLRPLLHGRLEPLAVDDALVDALLAGAARGLLYASVVEPRLPGSFLTRGALYGTAEYAVSPWGGVAGLVGKHAPHRRVPVLAGLFEEYADEEDTLLDHLAFALALAVLYGGGEGPEATGVSGD